MRLQEMAAWREGRPWLTNALLLVLGCGLLFFTRQFNFEQTSFWIGFSGCSTASAWIFVGAVAVVLTQPTDRWTLPIILWFAVLFELVLYFPAPFSSSDIYRYVWDGIVQHAHISPYRYVPGNEALRFLREPNQDVYDGINRRNYAVTIYPPGAQMLYWLITWVSASVEAMKLAMIGFVALTAWALLKLLRLFGRRDTDILLWVWCPVLVWEIAGAGHVDAALIAWMALALLFRKREQPVWCGLFLGLAIMTKFYPLVLLPVLWRRGDWKMPATVAGVCVLAYVPYLSVGMRVFGFLGGYAKEEGMDSGSRYFLLDYVHSLPGLHGLPTAVYFVFCAAVLGGVLLWAWRRGLWRSGDASFAAYTTTEQAIWLRAAMGLAFAMMLLFSPHYPWYVLWLVPFFALLRRLYLLTYLMSFFYWFTTGYAMPGPGMFHLNKWLYGATLVVFVAEWAWRRWGSGTAAEPVEARTGSGVAAAGLS